MVKEQTSSAHLYTLETEKAVATQVALLSSKDFFCVLLLIPHPFLTLLPCSGKHTFVIEIQLKCKRRRKIVGP